MSARAHVCVVLLMASTSTAGCLFGGGKKQAGNVTQSATATNSAGDSAATDGPREIDPFRDLAERPDASGAPVPPRRDARAVDAAVARAVAPSDVEWPEPDGFHLGDAPSTDPQRTGRDATSAAATADDAGHVAQGEPSAPRSGVMKVNPHTGAGRDGVASRTGNGTQGGVANEQLELPATPTASPSRAGNDLGASPVLVESGDLSRTLAQRLRDNPGDLAVHLDYQLLRFVEDEPVPDLGAIAGLQSEDREVLTALIDALSNFRNGVRADGNMLLSQKIKPLLELAGRLRSQAELSIPTISLCRRVQAFGIYEPMAGRFAAGTLSHAIAYCELDNVSARRNENGEWESKLTQEAVLYREDGQRVWWNPKHAITDRSRNRRQDFFVAQPITLLSTLPIGRYVLKISVEDERVRRVAEATVPIEIVAALPPQQQQQQQPERAPKPNKPTSVPVPARRDSDAFRLKATSLGG